jgi:large repetitive protein
VLGGVLRRGGTSRRLAAGAVLLACFFAILVGNATAVDPVFTVAAASGPEGGSVAFTVTFADPVPEGGYMLSYSVTHGTTNAADFTGATEGNIGVAPGATTQTITLQLAEDTLDEFDETFTLNVSEDATGANTAAGTITGGGDTPPSATIGNVTVAEGNSGVVAANFPVQLSGPSGKDITVRYSTGDGTATAPGDYTPASNQAITIQAGKTAGTITVNVSGDSIPEAGDQFFFVNLTSAENATLGATTQGRGTITDDDVAPSASINDVAVTEGNVGTTNAVFTVSLSATAPGPIQIRYSTANGSASAPSDYVAATNATLNIAAGATSGQITIAVNGDTLPEGTGDPAAEDFFVDLVSATGASISSDSRGTARINDDDTIGAPTLSPASVIEGNSGTANLVFNVTIPPRGTSVTFNWNTIEGTATASGLQPDYSAASSVGSRTYGPSVTATNDTIVLGVLGDTLDEPNETLTLRLTRPGAQPVTALGTITNDDNNSKLSINDATADEPGTMKFTVTVAPASGRAVSVSWATADGTATAPADYASGSGQLTFAAGETTKTIDIAVAGDAVNEENETLKVSLSNPTGVPLANLIDDVGDGTIVDKNAPPSLSISDTTTREGVGADFVVTLAGTTLRTVTVRFETADGTAQAGSDYSARVGTLTFVPGEKTKTISVTVLDDGAAEFIETFSVSLGDPVNATITKSRGTAVIDASDQPASLQGGSTPPTTTPPTTTPPTTPTPPAGTKTEQVPRMILGPRTVLIGANGIAKMQVNCQKLSPIVCAGTVELERAAKPLLKLGKKPFSVKRGIKAYASIKLSARAVTLLRKNKSLRVKVVVLVKTSTQTRKVLPGFITLKATTALLKAKPPAPAPPKVVVDP